MKSIGYATIFSNKIVMLRLSSVTPWGEWSFLEDQNNALSNKINSLARNFSWKVNIWVGSLFKEPASVVGLARGPTRRGHSGNWEVTFAWSREELESLGNKMEEQ